MSLDPARLIMGTELRAAFGADCNDHVQKEEEESCGYFCPHRTCCIFHTLATLGLTWPCIYRGDRRLIYAHSLSWGKVQSAHRWCIVLDPEF